MERLFGAAASQTLWNLLAVSPVGGVVDSPLPARVREHVEAGLAVAHVTHPLEVWCDVSADVALMRRTRRWPARHPIHGPMPTATAIESTGLQPLGLGPVLRVDTARTVDVAGVAAWCRSQKPLSQKALSEKPLPQKPRSR